MAAARAGSSQQRVWAAAEAVFAGMYARRPDWARLAAATAISLHDPHDAVQRFLAHHAEGAAASLSGNQPAAEEALRLAQAVLTEERLLDDHPGLLLWAVNADLFLDRELPALPPEVEQQVTRLRESGELMWSPRVVRLAAIRDHSSGLWDRAYAAFEEATELSRVSGQRTQVAEGLLLQAAVEAARGERELCWEHTEEAREIVQHLEVRWLEEDAWSIRGLLHLSLDEPESAVECYRHCTGPGPDGTADLVEALVRAGRPAEAERVLGGSGPPSPGVRSVAAALLADDRAGAQRLLEHAEEVGDVFEAARWRFTAGSMLRRCGARREAREHLRLAETVFVGLRATPWVHRAQQELRASGATVRQGPEGQALTAGELRVASLVAQGRSNKQVASALFLSPKTVEFHLGRAFRKLGVTNRTALAARLAEQGHGQPTAS
jgi:DNA-binding CsgD family transcriptional regulator